MRYLKRCLVVCSLSLACLVSSCSSSEPPTPNTPSTDKAPAQSPAPAVAKKSTSTPTAITDKKSATPQTAVIAPPSAPSAVRHPALSSGFFFTSLDTCVKSGGSSEECLKGYSTAASMHLASTPKYSTSKLCQNVFKRCTVANPQSSPQMEGFGMVQDPKTKAQFYMPLYKNVKDEWVEITQDGGKVKLTPAL